MNTKEETLNASELRVEKGWYPNGQMKFRESYKGAILDGLCEVWWKNGQLMSRGSNKGGNLNGLYEEWYENGQLKARENYKEGKPHGLHEEWSPSGQLMCRDVYKNGNFVEALPFDEKDSPKQIKIQVPKKKGLKL